MSQSLAYLLFPGLMAFAASYDLLSMRISNGLCLLVAASFFPLAAFAGFGLDAILLHTSCAAAMLGVGFLIFARGWIGGGDAKLFAAASIWFGWSHVAGFALAVAVAGGLLGAGVIALRLFPAGLERWGVWCGGLGMSGAPSELPYGVALAAGALAVYPLTAWPIVLLT